MPQVRLPIEEVLSAEPVTVDAGEEIGRSREGRPLAGFAVGRGPISISLVAGCHADEPVGPALLRKLVAFLSRLEADSPLRSALSWTIVPHANPDGEERNRRWSRRTEPLTAGGGDPGRGYILSRFLEHAVREAPGDDLEFGFPRAAADAGARPEARAVANYLAARGPFHLHASLHGMALAPGPWFLLEPAWIERTGELRRRLARRVAAMGYHLFDPDRGGDKGFTRIAPGFSTRPDSSAMREHFELRGDRATARRFRPSSMEFVRGLGGDPLTLVPEMPLFLTPPLPVPAERQLEALGGLRARLARAAASGRSGDHREAPAVRPMPIGDQMLLQLALLDEGLEAVRCRR